MGNASIGLIYVGKTCFVLVILLMNSTVSGFWSEWSACSVTCDQGVKKRFISPIEKCLQLIACTDITECDTGVPCAERVNSYWGDWTNWSGCFVTCGNGSQTRTRYCYKSELPNLEGFDCIGSSLDTRTCNTGVNCPVYSFWGDWTNWSGCFVTCGNGSQTRTRYCYNSEKPVLEGFDCIGSSLDSQTCNTGVTCPENGNWGYWSGWSGCSETCGDGSQTRTRKCNNPVPTNGGAYCDGSNSDLQTCNTGIACPVNESWGTWASWNSCSVTCGDGYQTRTRLCNNPVPSNGGSPCIGSATASQSCYTGVACPVNGTWGFWTSWSGCSVTCENGSQTRTRTCDNPPPSNGGLDCSGLSTESKSCNTGVACPVNGTWGYWNSWGGCSVTCGTGAQTRTRLCNNPAPANGGFDCSGSRTESQSCYPGVLCPVNGAWGFWTSWTGCSVTCAGGSQTRTRKCDNPVPANGGYNCSGSGIESQSCNTGVICPVNGTWGYWNSWGGCSVTCGTGAQTRTRLCNNPAPANGGFDCSGSRTESQSCYPGVLCPVNGAWGFWTSWTGCSVTCAGGSQTRTRKCDNPVPANGGYNCSGSGIESQSCNTGVTCPVTGTWGFWTSWSGCSVTCGNGNQTRTRECDNPSPANGGSDCTGPMSEKKSCLNSVICPVNGTWGFWTSWSGCSKTCGNGSQIRTRECDNPAPVNGGSDCSGSSTESKSCDTGVVCPVDGNWGVWTYGSCTVTCGGGAVIRNRSCDEPPPSNGGSDCVGNATERDICNTEACPDSRTNEETKIIIITGIVASVLVVSLLMVFFFFCRRKRTKSSSKENETKRIDFTKNVFENDLNSYCKCSDLSQEQIKRDSSSTGIHYDNVK